MQVIDVPHLSKDALRAFLTEQMGPELTKWDHKAMNILFEDGITGKIFAQEDFMSSYFDDSCLAEHKLKRILLKSLYDVHADVTAALKGQTFNKAKEEADRLTKEESDE